MAHGKKKWIVAYDGKIKRSNDRTKKDYYRDLKWWDEPYFYRWNNWNKQKYFCPQCKHVQKPILAEHNERQDAIDKLRAEYDLLFGVAVKQWHEYIRLSWDENNLPIKPKLPEPPAFWTWAHNIHKVNIGLLASWNYDTRSYLCWKCERKYEKKLEMWDWHHSTGHKNRYRYERRQEYKQYKNKVNGIMQRAKFDDELYEDIPHYKHGWLD